MQHQITHFIQCYSKEALYKMSFKTLTTKVARLFSLPLTALTRQASNNSAAGSSHSPLHGHSNSEEHLHCQPKEGVEN